MEKKEISAVLRDEGLSKSKKMLMLYDGGMELKEISKVMDVNYHFVYNVVSNSCRKRGEELRVSKKDGSVKSEIIKLIKEGKSNVEISKELKKDYNMVFKVRKEYELSK